MQLNARFRIEPSIIWAFKRTRPLGKELEMKEKVATPKVWTKPKLQRLGKIQDVAGAQGAGAQAGGFKT